MSYKSYYCSRTYWFNQYVCEILMYGCHKTNINLNSILLLARIDREIYWLNFCILVGIPVHK